MKFLKLFLIDFGQHQKVVHDQPSVKWSSRKSNYMLLKVNKIHTFFFQKILLEKVIGQQMKEERHDKKY